MCLEMKCFCDRQMQIHTGDEVAYGQMVAVAVIFYPFPFVKRVIRV